MKSLLFFLLLLLLSLKVCCQPPASFVLVKHDTVILQATDCEWIIRTLVNNDSLSGHETGKSIPLVILEAIRGGRLKAIDPQTSQPIPANEIFTWRMPIDTVSRLDTSGNFVKYTAVQAERNAADFTRLRICQDWYFDPATATLQPLVKWIELIVEIRSSSGFFTGHMPFCRIYH